MREMRNSLVSLSSPASSPRNPSPHQFLPLIFPTEGSGTSPFTEVRILLVWQVFLLPPPAAQPERHQHPRRQSDRHPLLERPDRVRREQPLYQAREDEEDDRHR